MLGGAWWVGVLAAGHGHGCPAPGSPVHAPSPTHPPLPLPPAQQLLDGNKYLLSALGSGLWPVMVLLSEVVQTFILADFWCVRDGGSGENFGRWTAKGEGSQVRSAWQGWATRLMSASEGPAARHHCVGLQRTRPFVTRHCRCRALADAPDPPPLPAPCSFYYVKSYVDGTGIVRLPVGIV